MLDPFAGAGTTNYVAIKNNRNAIGVELREDFYELANEKRFSKLTDEDFELNDSTKEMTERFIKEKAEAEKIKDEKKAEAEEKKELTKVKKSLREEIKELEVQLVALGVKKSEIKKIKQGVMNLD